MAPFLADIDILPRALLDTTFSITGTYRTGRVFDGRGNIRRVTVRQPATPVFPAKMVSKMRIFLALLGAIGEGAGARFRARHGRPAAARGGGWRRIDRTAVDHAGKSAEAS